MSLLTLADAKTHLNITVATYDAELQTFIDEAEAAIGKATGSPFGTASFDEWHDGGRATVYLLEAPVATVTTVSEAYGAGYNRTLTEQPLDGSGFDAFGYTVDKTDGTITRRAVGRAMPFVDGRRNVHVVYTAGYTAGTLPSDLLLAVKELVRDMFKTQRGSAARRPGSEIDLPLTSNDFPANVMRLISPYMHIGIG